MSALAKFSPRDKKLPQNEILIDVSMVGYSIDRKIKHKLIIFFPPMTPLLSNAIYLLYT